MHIKMSTTKKKRNKGKKKPRIKKKEKKKKQPTASHSSVKGQRPQERWIGAHWESLETPIAQSNLLASVRITDYQGWGEKAWV